MQLLLFICLKFRRLYVHLKTCANAGVCICLFWHFFAKLAYFFKVHHWWLQTCFTSASDVQSKRAIMLLYPFDNNVQLLLVAANCTGAQQIEFIIWYLLIWAIAGFWSIVSFSKPNKISNVNVWRRMCWLHPIYTHFNAMFYLLHMPCLWTQFDITTIERNAIVSITFCIFSFINNFLCFK